MKTLTIDETGDNWEMIDEQDPRFEHRWICICAIDSTKENLYEAIFERLKNYHGVDSTELSTLLMSIVNSIAREVDRRLTAIEEKLK